MAGGRVRLINTYGPTEIYTQLNTLSLHDALPIFLLRVTAPRAGAKNAPRAVPTAAPTARPNTNFPVLMIYSSIVVNASLAKCPI
jgi:hypothetical protein